LLFFTIKLDAIDSSNAELIRAATLLIKANNDGVAVGDPNLASSSCAAESFLPLPYGIKSADDPIGRCIVSVCVPYEQRDMENSYENQLNKLKAQVQRKANEGVGDKLRELFGNIVARLDEEHNIKLQYLERLSLSPGVGNRSDTMLQQEANKVGEFCSLSYFTTKLSLSDYEPSYLQKIKDSAVEQILIGPLSKLSVQSLQVIKEKLQAIELQVPLSPQEFEEKFMQELLALEQKKIKDIKQWRDNLLKASMESEQIIKEALGAVSLDLQQKRYKEMALFCANYGEVPPLDDHLGSGNNGAIKVSWASLKSDPEVVQERIKHEMGHLVSRLFRNKEVGTSCQSLAIFLSWREKSTSQIITRTETKKEKYYCQENGQSKQVESLEHKYSEEIWADAIFLRGGMPLKDNPICRQGRSNNSKDDYDSNYFKKPGVDGRTPPLIFRLLQAEIYRKKFINNSCEEAAAKYKFKNIFD